ncbi:unnamed protein product [Mytilus edulis]|uniref:Uncharacterized protein n=1 Tax=Mytilus edulis TaxID=6550 RepID=A0A8S3SZS1_MYTED|nr:unnamed protein product [Mytilus edulis]
MELSKKLRGKKIFSEQDSQIENDDNDDQVIKEKVENSPSDYEVSDIDDNMSSTHSSSVTSENYDIEDNMSVNSVKIKNNQKPTDIGANETKLVSKEHVQNLVRALIGKWQVKQLHVASAIPNIELNHLQHGVLNNIEKKIQISRHTINKHLDCLESELLKELTKIENEERKKISQILASVEQKEKEIDELFVFKDLHPFLLTFLVSKQIEQELIDTESIIHSMQDNNELSDVIISLQSDEIVKGVNRNISTIENSLFRLVHVTCC